MLPGCGALAWNGLWAGESPAAARAPTSRAVWECSLKRMDARHASLNMCAGAIAQSTAREG